MAKRKMLQNQFKHPILTVDVVLFTIIAGELSVLLAKRNSQSEIFPEVFTIPGGYVHPEEDMDLKDSAIRVLKNKINFTGEIYLEQLESFSGSYRDPRGWSVSQAFCAILPETEVKSSDSIQWVKVSEINDYILPFDHSKIVNKAIIRIRSKTTYSTLPVYFFKDKFTLTELQKVYEVILGQKLDKSSFRKRIEDMEVLELLTGDFKLGAQRPAQLYKVKKDVGVWFKSNLA